MFYYIYAVNKKGISCRKQDFFTDENSVSFQMFLILLPSITLCSESQVLVFKEGQSNTWKSVLFCLFVLGGKGEHAQKPKFGTLLGSISRVFH